MANVFVAALNHPGAARSTFEVVWENGAGSVSLPGQLAGLKPEIDVVRAGDLPREADSQSSSIPRPWR
jgi:hypothetical protein